MTLPAKRPDGIPETRSGQGGKLRVVFALSH